MKKSRIIGWINNFESLKKLLSSERVADIPDNAEVLVIPGPYKKQSKLVLIWNEKKNE